MRYSLIVGVLASFIAGVGCGCSGRQAPPEGGPADGGALDGGADIDGGSGAVDGGAADGSVSGGVDGGGKSESGLSLLWVAPGHL
jgi:hypothetical protein